jgi:predicted transcriptional regulator
MQNHYTDKFDIIASVLGFANGNEIKQAQILTKANIPHKLFKEYLFLLHRYGLIEIEYIQRQYQRTYRTTAKGIHFLGIYQPVPLSTLSR